MNTKTYTVKTYHGKNLAQSIAFLQSSKAMSHARKCADHAVALGIEFRVTINGVVHYVSH